MTTLGELGEFGFIDRIAPLLPQSAAVIEGIGDDCAVLEVGHRLLLVSCDLSIENIHFRRGVAKPEDIGWKAAASSLSDIAAMGGTPLFAVISLAAPADTKVEELLALYRGMRQATDHCGAAIVGGDTARSFEGITLDVTVIGESTGPRYLTRKGAEPGDFLAVTGLPGRAAGGLHAQETGADAPALLKAHYRPQPRIREGQWLCGRPEVHALIDVSDGVAQDAGHLARAAGLGIGIESEKLPVDAELGRYCTEKGLDARELILGGGEDYELAFAIGREQSGEILAAFSKEFDLPATVVGEFTADFEGVQVDGARPALRGFDHFGPGAGPH